MIVGKGMVAQKFEELQNREDICLFASGVSNSNEISPNEFNRERKLLLNHIKRNKSLFVYFSSCSLEDIHLQNNPYHEHKSQMEEIIKAESNSFIIFRLPNLIGKFGNEKNVINYFFKKILNKQKFIIWANATRNILDIDDAFIIGKYIIENEDKYRNKTINIAYKSNIPVIKIVKSIEIFLGKEAIYEIQDKGTDLHIDIKTIMPIMQELDIQQPTFMSLLTKYKGNTIR